MVELINSGVYLIDGKPVPATDAKGVPTPGEGRERTMAYSIMRSHDKSKNSGKMKIKFDALISHDITYVGVIQTARASGMTEFPVPYALTNCHNSLCAVGGTINEDDHAFGLSAAMKYGGIYVPANQAVIHQYARECLAACGNMILGSDSHTRYGCYGTMGIGEGGGELVKQLLKNTYDVDAPEVVLVWLEGTPKKGVGPHDVAIAMVGATFPGGAVKNKILEFAGPGIAGLDIDYRIGIDVMTTETSCLSSIWETDGEVKKYYETVGRPQDYKELRPKNGAYYDSIVKIDLSTIENMIALPFHPSNAYTIHELQENPGTILAAVQQECQKSLGDQVEMDLLSCIEDGKVVASQGVIVGCSGGMYNNLVEAAAILDGGNIGDGYFDLSVYPSSSPITMAVTKDGTAATFMEAGGVMKPAFCGPCFGAGDAPSHNALSIRHATRNFANREGSKPGNGQISAVALMDARSIAATAANKGVLTAATDIDYDVPEREYVYDGSIYEKRCYNGYGAADPSVELKLGPNITNWPKMPKLQDNLLVKLAAVIHDDVTTTDELIPSGETSSYRSNPIALSEFTLSRRVPEYVERSKAIREMETQRQSGAAPDEALEVLQKVGGNMSNTSIGSCIFATKPGDGSAREQAASCQKVLGGFANICYEFATKRYRSNCINWGVVPFTIDRSTPFGYSDGDYVYIPGLRQAILDGRDDIPGKIITQAGNIIDIPLQLKGFTDEEKLILTEGCLMNYYAAGYGSEK